MTQSIRIFDHENSDSCGRGRSSSCVHVSIVVPAYQEAENLPEHAARLFAAASTAQLKAELIIVDDNSGDGTL